MRVWKIAPGRYAENWEEARDKGRIFIGWSEMGDLTQFADREDLVDFYQETYEVSHNPINDSFTLWAFTHLIQPGDIIIANKGGKSIVGIGKVTGHYEYQPEDNSHFPNVRNVDWIIQQEIPLTKKQFPNKTLAEVSEDRLEAVRVSAFKKYPDLAAAWGKLFDKTEGDVNVHHSAGNEKSNDFVGEFLVFARSRGFAFDRELITRFVTSLMSKPFLILSGISGTGKTKIAQLFADFMTQQTIQKPSKSSNGDLKFEYRLQPYNFEHKRIEMPTELVWQLEQFELDFNEGAIVTVRYGGFAEEALMKKQPNGTIRLGLRKGISSWLNNNFEINEYIKVHIRNEGTVWEFSDQSSSATSRVPAQTAFLSVRPDWLDHRGLLGGHNPLTEKYQATEMLKVLLRAQRAPEHPFFVILDEMNLAKVEYYFSDFLSCLESRRLKDDGLQQEAIQLHQADAEVAQGLSFVEEDGTVYQIPPAITIPENLYFIGTVNVDETTYMFSPKVLDRAHVIECNTIDFAAYRHEIAGMAAQPYEPQWSYKEKVEYFTTDGEFHKALYAKAFLRGSSINLLQTAFTWADSLKDLLTAQGYSFGYRVFDEGMTFIDQLLGYEYYANRPELAFDLMVLQKILPKLHGNRAQMETALNNLFQFCMTDVELEEEGEKKRHSLEGAIHEDFKGDFAGLRFPKSAEKIHVMNRQLVRTGYCSFIQ